MMVAALTLAGGQQSVLLTRRLLSVLATDVSSSLRHWRFQNAELQRTIRVHVYQLALQSSSYVGAQREERWGINVGYHTSA